jgi:hypothetical protein
VEEYKKAECPEPSAFAKWFEKQAASNANTRPDIAPLTRIIPIVATEMQINDEYELIDGDFKPGEVLAALTECGLHVSQYKGQSHQDEGYILEMPEL